MTSYRTAVYSRQGLVHVRDVYHHPRPQSVSAVHFQVIPVGPLSRRRIPQKRVVLDGEVPSCRCVEVWQSDELIQGR